MILVDILIAEAPTEPFLKWSAHPGVEPSILRRKEREVLMSPEGSAWNFFNGTVHLSTPLVYV